ncbi:hypothetical protein OK016_22035 [Vibrio chagasii]|nr:hypothetical protein [Vibrio chagasii]
MRQARTSSTHLKRFPSQQQWKKMAQSSSRAAPFSQRRDLDGDQLIKCF